MSSIAEVVLTVVMPAYNEEAAIEQAVCEAQRGVLDMVHDSEMIVVDDGSRDSTGAILDRLAAGDGRVRVIHQANGGHGRALRAGLDEARGEYLFLIDSDRQIPLDAFQALWRAGRGRDAALGIRTKRQDPWLRLVLTRVIRTTLRVLGMPLRDANCPFKVLRRSVWQTARKFMPPETLAPSLFLALFIQRRGLDYVEVEVPHRERTTGVVSIRRWKLLKFCTRSFFQLLVFYGRIGQ